MPQTQSETEPIHQSNHRNNDTRANNRGSTRAYTRPDPVSKKVPNKGNAFSLVPSQSFLARSPSPVLFGASAVPLQSFISFLELMSLFSLRFLQVVKVIRLHLVEYEASESVILSFGCCVHS